VQNVYMERALRLLEYLSNQQVGEEDLKRIYSHFLQAERSEGFESGYHYAIKIINEQRDARRANLKKRFDSICDYFDSLTPING